MVMPPSPDRPYNQKELVQSYKAGQASVRGTFVRRIYVLTALCLVATGIGFLLGPARFYSSGTYRIIRQMAPIDVWACAFLAVGLFKFFVMPFNRRELYRLGSALGGTLAMMWWIGLLSAFTGPLNQWGSVPSWFVVAAAQLMSAASVWNR